MGNPPGWVTSLVLPQAARDYLTYISEFVGVPIRLVGRHYVADLTDVTNYLAHAAAAAVYPNGTGLGEAMLFFNASAPAGAASAVSSGRVLNAIVAAGAALWTALTTISNRARLFGGILRPPPITTQRRTAKHSKEDLWQRQR